MIGSTKFTLFEKISYMSQKISDMSQKILLDIHHHMHQHMIEDTQKDDEDIYDTREYAEDAKDIENNQEILTIKIIKIDYDYIIRIIR